MTATDHEHPVWKLLDQMQMDIRQMNARMTQLRGEMSQIKLEVTAPVRCPDCRNTYPGQHDLELHAYQQHDGPIPTTWAIADTRAGDAPPAPFQPSCDCGRGTICTGCSRRAWKEAAADAVVAGVARAQTSGQENT